jgi:hypothetical protein
MMILKRLAGMAVVAAITVPSFAHDPSYEGDAEYGDTPATAATIDDIELSLAFYARLEPGGDVDVYTFEGQAGQRFYCQMTLPWLERMADFEPSFALIGPGLDDGENPLPFDLPDGAGILVAPSNGHDQREHFFEFFTRTNYWIDQEVDMPLPADGTYWVAVFADAEQADKYVLAPGYVEAFNVEWIIHFVEIWVETRDFTEEFGTRLLDLIFQFLGWGP